MSWTKKQTDSTTAILHPTAKQRTNFRICISLKEMGTHQQKQAQKPTPTSRYQTQTLSFTVIPTFGFKIAPARRLLLVVTPSPTILHTLLGLPRRAPLPSLKSNSNSKGA